MYRLLLLCPVVLCLALTACGPTAPAAAPPTAGPSVAPVAASPSSASASPSPRLSPTPKPTPDLSLAGRYIPSTTSASHVRAGTDIRYSSRPPTSGRHYAQTAGYGVFERDVAAGNWVHTLEHGGIVLLYRPDLCDTTCQDGLRAIYSRAPASQSFNVVKIAVVPYQDMDHAIAAVAWEWLDEMDSLDSARILKFYGDHLDKGPEQAL